MSKEFFYFQNIVLLFLCLLPIIQQKKIYSLKKRILNMKKIKRKLDKSLEIIETMIKSEAYKEAKYNVESFRKKNNEI